MIDYKHLMEVLEKNARANMDLDEWLVMNGIHVDDFFRVAQEGATLILTKKLKQDPDDEMLSDWMAMWCMGFVSGWSTRDGVEEKM